MPQKLSYDTLERLRPQRPVDRLGYISEACRGKHVLDIGCFDETALVKRDTEHWLHGRISKVAASVIGIDNSAALPAEGLATAPNASIFRGNGLDPRTAALHDSEIEVVVAGEFIEHIAPPLDFFVAMKQRFPGRRLVISTPNGATFANTLLGMVGREVQHPDHIQVFTYKILNTLCERAGFTDWRIIPYRFYATEMILDSAGAKKVAAQTAQGIIRIVERIFPLLSFGYVLDVTL